MILNKFILYTSYFILTSYLALQPSDNAGASLTIKSYFGDKLPALW